MASLEDWKWWWEQKKKPSQKGMGNGVGLGKGRDGKMGVLLRRSGGHQFCYFLSNLLLVEVDCQFFDKFLLLRG